MSLCKIAAPLSATGFGDVLSNFVLFLNKHNVSMQDGRTLLATGFQKFSKIFFVNWVGIQNATKI